MGDGRSEPADGAFPCRYRSGSHACNDYVLGMDIRNAVKVVCISVIYEALAGGDPPATHSCVSLPFA